ncbi:hypothetical protein M405DRAFT_815485 [Rhizopogon salebrosus TDB-379]|nr:hypothetical protein M405DRAFT_815485 [Rhizopogon salebrosus TDB-379]
MTFEASMNADECGDEKVETQRSPSGVEANLQTLKVDEGSEGDGGMQLRAMEAVGNEVG